MHFESELKYLLKGAKKNKTRLMVSTGEADLKLIMSMLSYTLITKEDNGPFWVIWYFLYVV